MRSIYVLSDYGVSITILKSLYEKSISYLDVEFFGEMYLKECKISKKNIELVLNAMTKAKNDSYQNSIQELHLFGLSNGYFRKVMQKRINYEALKLSEEEFCEKYHEKRNFYYELQNAYKELQSNNYNLVITDFSKYLLMMIKKYCEKKNEPISIIYNEMEKTSYPIEYFYVDLKKLEDKKVINVYNDEIEYIVPPLSKRIEKMEKRTQEILQFRLSGLTLKDIGEKFGLTKERIRQIIEREYNKLPFVNEDKYQSYYEDYDFSEEEFCKTFLEPKQTYYYLFDKYDKGSKDFYEIENDYLLPKEMVIRIKELKNEIYVNGEFIVGNRDGVLKYVLKNAKTNIRVDDLFEKFNEALNSDFARYNILGFDSVHNLEALLERKAWSISGSNKMFRYYEPKLIDKTDIENLKEILLSTQGFYSTLYFYENNIDLMEQLDIRNEQELHNFLRNYIHDEHIEYLRMPNILLNCDNKDDFILSMIYENSPINLLDFCKLLRDEYGHREDTMASYLSLEFGKYITNREISVSIRELSYEESETIMKSLDKSIYPVFEFEEILNSLNIKDGKNLLNNLNLNKLGYKIVGPYVVKKSFARMEDAIYKSIERGELDKTFLKTNSTSYCYIWNLIKSKKVLELNNQYVTFDILYKLGITEEAINDFESKVKATFIYENEFFTAKIIRNRIDCDLLNNYSLSDDMINGLIHSIGEYKRIFWKDNIIFIKSSNFNSRVKFLESILEKRNGLTLLEIKNILFEKYGVNVEEIDIRNILYAIQGKYIDEHYYIDEVV